MRVVTLTADTPVTAYGSVRASSAHLGDGTGGTHAQFLSFQPGGAIGPHPAGFSQLLIPLSGAGWVAGPDGRHRGLGTGQLAWITRGETHSKGSDVGMTALMVQVHEFTLNAGEAAV